MTRRDFVALVAHMLKDGEDDGLGGTYEQEPDDAIATLERLIDMAREINCRGDLDDGR